MGRIDFVAVAVLGIAIAGCKPSSGSASDAKETKETKEAKGGKEGEGDKSEPAAAVGKFATATLADFEGRAKKKGWKVLTSSSNNDDGFGTMDLELEDSSHYAYVTVIDLAEAAKKPATMAAKMGADRAVLLQLDEENKKAKPADQLDKLLAKSPLDAATRDTVTKALAELGWKVGATDSTSEDGLATHTIAAENKEGDSAIDVMLFDFSAAKKDGRVAVDGMRIINVFVCKDCTERKTKFTSAVWQNTKARGLLGKLTNP
jgi:hypothetical protein